MNIFKSIKRIFNGRKSEKEKIEERMCKNTKRIEKLGCAVLIKQIEEYNYLMREFSEDF